MIAYGQVLALLMELCPRCAGPTRLGPTAHAIYEVARTREEAAVLAVVAFAETGFWAAPHFDSHGAWVRAGVPFGASAFHHRHPGASLPEHARAALASVAVGLRCGAGFADWMRMYLSGGCGGSVRVRAESARRERMLARLLGAPHPTAIGGGP